jgi:hypothetical protein
MNPTFHSAGESIIPPLVGSGPRGHHPTPFSGNRLRPGSGGGSARDGVWRLADVWLTNTGAVAVKSVRLDFVFRDAANGAELLRLSRRNGKRLKPGQTLYYDKVVKRSKRTRRGDGARMSVELTEVVYADGSVWRP